MAMKNLVEGECGGSNSLLQLTSHFTKDQSLLQEGLSRDYIPAVIDGQWSGEADQYVHEFLGERQNWMSELHTSAPSTFHMSSLIQEMQEIEKETIHPPLTGPGVADLAKSAQWAAEFLNKGANQIDESSTSQPLYLPPQESLESLKYASEYLDEIHDDHSQRRTDVLKNEDALTNFELAEAADKLLESVDDPKINESEFVDFVKKIRDGEITLQDGKLTKSKESDNLISEFLGAEGYDADSVVVEDSAENIWASEFSGSLMSEEEQEKANAEYWEKLQRDWEKLIAKDPEQHPWLSQYEEMNDVYKEYNFVKENNLVDHPNAFQEGLNCLKQHDLPSAVLLFEAAVQKDPLHADAWYYLGTTQAENEQDICAISALRKCLDLGPQNLKCMLALAVSYTNESLQSQACFMLHEWIKSHPKYSELVSDKSDASMLRSGNLLTSSIMSQELHQKVANLYIKAVRMSPTEIDSDVQCGLGVLFNLSGEYDKAVDCFNAALQIRPEDALLWNRLGATLANGNRSEEAVDAYHEALKISPGFIRCRYNLGVSCVNLGSYREAAEHLLTGLNLQAAAQSVPGKSSQSVMSDNIWSTLRLVMTLMNRTDLYPSIDSHNLSTLNSEFMTPES